MAAFGADTVPVTPRHARVAGACLGELPAVQPRPPDQIAARLAASGTAFARSRLPKRTGSHGDLVGASAAMSTSSSYNDLASAAAASMPTSSSYNDLASLERETFDTLEERTRAMLERANVAALEGVVEAKAHAAKRAEAGAARASHRDRSLEAWRRSQKGRAGVRWTTQPEERTSLVEREERDHETSARALRRSQQREREEAVRQLRSPSVGSRRRGSKEVAFEPLDGGAAAAERLSRARSSASAASSATSSAEEADGRDEARAGRRAARAERPTNAASFGSASSDQSDDEDHFLSDTLSGFDELSSSGSGAGSEAGSQASHPSVGGLKMTCRVTSSGLEWTYIQEDQITWRAPTAELLAERGAAAACADQRALVAAALASG